MSTSKKIPQYGKLDLEECVKNFRILVLNNINDITRLKSDLITPGKLCHCDKVCIRGFCWKIFLNVLPINEKISLKNWLEETLSQRKKVKKMIKNNTINKLKGDPLGGINASEEKEKNSGWNDFLVQSEMIKMIKYDVDRTMPTEKLFQEPFIRDIETKILTNFSKNHKKFPYKQGMNEILSLIIYAMFPYYVKSPNNKYTNELFDKWIQNPIENAKDIYCFFHDENEFESDIYSLFDNLMIKLGLAKFFEEEPKDNKVSAYFIRRIKNIIINKLSIQDKALYTHFKNQNLDYAMVFQRWLKCLFKREFPLPDTCLIWDYIFANEAEKHSGMLVYIDYIVLAMIINIKSSLLNEDSNGMFELFLHYPKVPQINNLLKQADQIENDLNLATVEEKKNNDNTKKEDKDKDKEKEINKIEESNQTQEQNNINLNNNINNNNIPNPLGQINPLLINQNMTNNPMGNLMLAMMMQQAAKGQINNTTVNDSSSEINELKELVNKYKDKINIEDKNRMDFLIDLLGKK